MPVTTSAQNGAVIPSKINQALGRWKQLESRRQPWKDTWQLLGEYIHTRKQEFTTERSNGDFLNREIFDSVGPKANKTMASSLLGMLWPASAKRFQLRPPDVLPDSRENKNYYDTITGTVRRTLDNTKAGLRTALDEYMQDQGCFGTSGVEPVEHDELDVIYRAWSVKEMAVAEGPDGKVDTVYLNIKYPLHVVVKIYGINNVSRKVREAFEKQKFDEEIELLIAIEPRLTRTPGMAGTMNMPFQSLHIELDAKHLLRESGFTELPVKVGRFSKIIKEEYGRSPGMDALPDILEANAIWESVTVAIEKNLDPPLAVLDDGRLGSTDINTSAGALNVLNISGRAGDKNPIFPLFTVGEIKQTVSLLEHLAQSISDHFFIDRLLDFNNETQMTLGEAQIRNRMRHATLGSVISRQIAEVFNPVVEATFNILLRRNKLGVLRNSVEHAMAVFEGREVLVIPDQVAELMLTGQDVYQIEYFTPAMRIMQAEEAEGIFRTWEFAGQVAAVQPQVIDNLDPDMSIKRFAEVNGAPSSVIRSAEDVEEIRKERDRQQKLMQEIELAKASSEAARNVGQSGLVPTQQQAA